MSGGAESRHGDEVELEGGPRCGMRVRTSGEAVTLLLHNVPVSGALTAYCRTDRTTDDGLWIFSWLGTAPPRRH